MDLPEHDEFAPCPRCDQPGPGDRWWDESEVDDSPVHMCPPKGSGLTPCCGKTPLELGRWHRLTLNPELVTCHA